MTDTKLERIIGTVLRVGVLISGTVVLAGGVYFLLRHGGQRVDYHRFHSQPDIDRRVHLIVAAAFALRAQSIIQCGILLLIATPIARVAFSLVGFALEGDRKYVVITAIVLAVLLYSLISGALQAR